MVAAPPHAATVVGCAWCGVPVEVSDASGGPAFCCSGCEGAHAVVVGAGAQALLDQRQVAGPRPGPVDASALAGLDVRTAADGTCEVVFRVGELGCPACGTLVERVLDQQPAVRQVELGRVTGVVRLVFDPATGDLDGVLRPLLELGYRASPELSVDARGGRDLTFRLGVATFVAVQVMMLAAPIYIGAWSGLALRYEALFAWTALALATPVALWAAAPFHAGAWRALRLRGVSMDLPVSLAVLGMYVHGVWAVPHGQPHFLDSLTMVVALLLGGRLIDQRGRDRAAQAARGLAARLPQRARRVISGPGGDRIDDCAAADLVPGDVVEVASGEELAADGVVVHGTAEVRLDLLTGESDPVAAGVGTELPGGGAVWRGSLRVKVLRQASESLLSRLVDDVAGSAAAAAPSPAIARLAPWFTVGTLGVAAVAGALWAASAGTHVGISVAVAVLVVACPCALSLAEPLSAMVAMGAAARAGLLVRSAAAVRQLGTVDLVVLDKTGTLTWGQPRITHGDDATLRIAAGLERSSIHPLGRALVAEAVRRGIAVPRSTDVAEQVGVGLVGTVDGRRWSVRGGDAHELVVRCLGGPALGEGVLGLVDTPREDAAQTVAKLEDMGIEVVMLSGDKPQVADEIGRAVGITTALGGVGPREKAAWVQARQAEGRTVLVAGDGLNDGGALAAADVGVAMARGAAPTVVAADVVVLGEALGAITSGLQLGRAAARVTRRGVRRAVAYNLVCVALAAAGWIGPLAAAILMPLSSAAVLVGARAVPREAGEGPWTS